MSLYLVAGDKGGVGKSQIAEAFTDYLIERKKLKPVVVEADMRNPDVARMFEGVCDVERINLREKEGWFELSSIVHEAAGRPVVLSLPGNIGDAMERYNEVLAEALRDLKQDAYMFWVLNREPDSINLLRVALDSLSPVLKRTVAVRNLHWGEAAKFTRWNESKTREKLLADGGLEIDIEDLHDKLVDATKRALPKAVRFSAYDDVKDPDTGEALRYGFKAELKRWVDSTFRAFDGIASKIGIGAKAAPEPEPAKVG